MSRESKSNVLSHRLSSLMLGVIAFGVCGIAVADPGTGGEAASDEARSSISTHVVRGGRDNPAARTETVEEYDALVTAGNRSLSKTARSASKPGATGGEASSANWDFWIYDVDVILFNDDDRDGYYHGIDLLFDADTIYAAADVYAVMYLSYEGGPWNEYAVTEDFTLFGATADDEYVLVTELMSGYPTGNYDLLIELFDPFDGAFLASYGPSDSSELSYLPLEDFNRDAPPPPPDVIIVDHHGGGGALDAWLIGAMLILLIASVIRKVWRHRSDALVRIDAPDTRWRQ